MISFIIPVYNKGSILFRTLSSLFKNLSEAGISEYEVIVVNDGSTDNSFEEAVRFKKFNGATEKIKIYHYTKNIGKGFALRFGFSKSHGYPVVFLDGDMDISTQQIMYALSKFQKTDADMVIGSKYHPQSRIFYPFNRFLYSFILKQIIRLLFNNLTISDTQVGLKIFKRDLLNQVLPRLIIKRFAVDLELLVVSNILNFRDVVEVPVVIKYSVANQSSIDLFSVKNFCQDILAIYYRKNFMHFYDHKEKMLVTPSFLVQSA